MTSGNKHIPGIKKVVSYLFPFVLTAIFLFLAFKDMDINEALVLMSHASIPWLLVFLFVFLLAPYIRALRWKVMISSVKKDASVVNLFGATMIGYGINLVIPRLGELYKALFLGSWEKVSRSSLFGTVVVERVIDVIALGVAVVISGFVYGTHLYDQVEWLKSTLYIGLALAVVAISVLILVVVLKEKFYNIITKLVGKVSTKAGETLAHVFHMLVDGFNSIQGTRNYIYTIVLTAIIMFLYGLNSYLGFYMLKMDQMQEITFGMAWVVMTISAFGIVIPTPGGTGSYHFIVISVLVGLYGFAEEISAAYALLTHLISYVVFILSTVLSIYFINKRQIRKGGKKENLFTVLKYRTEE